MIRLLVSVSIIVVTAACVQAQGRFPRTAHGQYRGFRPTYATPNFGLSVGVGGFPGYGYPGFGYWDPYRFDGFGYDPYRFGSFQAPDLLKDPYFREQHRYDSHFPGRYSSQYPTRYRRSCGAQLEYRSQPVYQPPYGLTNQYPHLPDAMVGTAQVMTEPPVVSTMPGDLVSQLVVASGELSRSLSIRRDADAWLNYLVPQQISELVASGSVNELRALLTRYDGVATNPDMRNIALANGFTQTRNLLTQYVNQPVETSEVLELPPEVSSDAGDNDEHNDEHNDEPVTEDLPIRGR